MLKELIEAQKLKSIIDKHGSIGKHVFDTLWYGSMSDWDLLGKIAMALTDIHHAVQDGYLSTSDLEFLSSAQVERLRPSASDYSSDYKTLKHSLAELFNLIDYSREAQLELNSLPIAELRARLQSWQQSPEQIASIAAYNSARERFKQEGLGEFYDAAVNWEYATHHMVNLFKRNWFDQLIIYAIHQRPALKDFDGLTHQARINKFREMDLLLLARNRNVIAKRHSETLSRALSTTGQVRILREEFNKKRRHKPIRRLIAETYGAVQSVKPIFLMSPMSVATYLTPGTIDFDVVIFDEASQIRPADAFGSILRAKQVVVVGDNRQMPPTSFFDSIGEADDDDDTAISDFDSILDVFTSKGLKDQMLRWHYRSRHESLIAVSNYEFYENRLLIPPSPQPRDQQVGLVLNYLPDTAYEPGTRRHNRGEARAVAQAVIKHAIERPELTLGIAAFSQAQMQAIRDELEILRRTNLHCENFFKSHPQEPFFIKNLENVQGDERDVIFISVGYGKTADGRVSLNFGPLNRDGGERRLNVLISRARLRCEVFTNLSSDDIDLDRTQSRGISALKNFLNYARTGELGVDTPSGREAGSPFEEVVAEKLIQRGYKVHYQVGTAGFFIDIAIVDPEIPGRYLIGIECDGATYHRSASARDRDRLRQTILESKGWVIHRIWSTDWFNNPDKELTRAIDAIETNRHRIHHRDTTAIQNKIESVERQSIARSTNVTWEATTSSIASIVVPYKLYKVANKMNLSSIEELPAQKMQEVISKILSVESPIHVEELERRVVQVLGLNRVTKKIRDTIQISLTMLNSGVSVDDNFVLMSDGSKIVVRDRSELPSESRKFEYIHRSEIHALARQICQLSLGIQADELTREICRIFGFNRVSQQMQAHVGHIIDEMVNSGELDTRAGGLWISTTVSAE